MTSFDDVNRLILAAAGVPEGGSLGPALKDISPQDFRRGYLTAGPAADSPANTGRRVPVPPPGDDDGPGEGTGVEKVIDATDFDRGYLDAGHAAASPGDMGDSNPVAPRTGSGTETYRHAAETYNVNAARERLQHVAVSHECVSEAVPARWSPPSDLNARNVPVPRAAGATRKAPGE